MILSNNQLQSIAMRPTIPYRPLQYLVLMSTAFVLSMSYYLEYVQHLEPCLLCITQRFCIIGLFIGTVLSCWIGQGRKTTCIHIILSLIALAGLFFASRQLWLQSLSDDQLPACLPGFHALIHYFPWQTAMRGMLWGSASCAEITWSWLGLSLAGWSLLYFLMIFMIQSLTIYMKKNHDAIQNRNS